MWATHLNRRSRYARKQFTLELLEVRQFMAADLGSQPLLSLSNPTTSDAVRSYDGTDNNLTHTE